MITATKRRGFILAFLAAMALAPQAANAATGVLFVHGTSDHTEASALTNYWTQGSIDAQRAGRDYKVVGYSGAAQNAQTSWKQVVDQACAWASSKTDIVIIAHSNGVNVVRYMLARQSAWTGANYVSCVTSKTRKVILVAGSMKGTILADKVLSGGSLASIANAVWSFFGSSYNNEGVKQQTTYNMATYNSQGVFGGTAGASMIGGKIAQNIVGSSVNAAIWSSAAYCGGYATSVGLKATLIYGWGYSGCSDGFVGCDSASYSGSNIQWNSNLNHNQSRRNCRAASTISANVSNTIGYDLTPPESTVSPTVTACDATNTIAPTSRAQGCSTTCADGAVCQPGGPACADGSACKNRSLPWWVTGTTAKGFDCYVAYGNDNAYDGYGAQDAILNAACPTGGTCSTNEAACTSTDLTACGNEICPLGECADGAPCDGVTACDDGSTCSGGGVCGNGSGCTRGTTSCAPTCRFSCRNGDACAPGAADACTNGITDNYALTAYNLFTCSDSWRGDGGCDFCLMAKYGQDVAPGSQTGADDCAQKTVNLCYDLWLTSNGKAVENTGYCMYNGKCVRDSDGTVDTSIAYCGSGAAGCTSSGCNAGQTCKIAN